MKKLIVLLLVGSLLFSGCALMAKVCNPTESEKTTIESYKVQASILLAFLRTQVPVPEVQAAIAGMQFAISVYDQVLAGVCLAAEVVQNANKTVETNQTMARMKMKYRY